jgi:hypothetical protein
MNWIWDPRSGEKLILDPDPGVKKSANPGSATLLVTKWIPEIFAKSQQILRKLFNTTSIEDPHP